MGTMRALFKRLFVLPLAVLLAACAAAPAAPAAPGGGSAEAPQGQLRIVTTVSPITNIAYNIAGDKAQIAGIVPEGVNSHTFEPAPSDAKVLAQADLIFANGLKLEEPTLKLAEANLKQGAEIVLLGEQTITPDQYVYDFSFPKEAGSPNPHLWPNPAFALRYAEIMRDTLSKRDPANASYYAANYDGLRRPYRRLGRCHQGHGRQHSRAEPQAAHLP